MENKEETSEIVKKDIGIQITPTIKKPYRSICCTRYKDRAQFENILYDMELSEIQKQIIRIRYINILENFQKRARNYSYIFFSGHTIITVGSLFVPALLSIQNSDKTFTFTGDGFSVHIYWITFVISLLVTIFNGILTLFKIDKKYYFLHTTLERLRSEGWQYFSLTGRYSGHLINHDRPTYQNQFVFFTHYIEKIKMKQVEEEYYKAEDKTKHMPNSTNNNLQQGTSNELYPPSPDQPIINISNNIPEPVKEAVNSLIKSQSVIEPENIIVIPSSARSKSRSNTRSNTPNKKQIVNNTSNNKRISKTNTIDIDDKNYLNI